MAQLGEANATLFLARFALLAIDRLADADIAERLIAAAAEDLAPTASCGTPSARP